MKPFLKWAAIVIAAIVLYVVFEGLPEERKNALFVIFVACGAAYSVMDYVNIKQRETMEKLKELNYKLDDLSASVPDEDRIALAVLDYSKRAENQAIKDREILQEVNSIFSGKK